MRRPTCAIALIAAALVGAAACSSGSSGGGPGGSSGSSSGSTGSSSGASSGSSGSSSGSGGTVTVSCDFSSTNSHYCFEWDNVSTAKGNQETAGCMMSRGTVGTGCAKTNLLGSCTTSAEVQYYYCGMVSAYETNCATYMGTWMPGTGGQVTCG